MVSSPRALPRAIVSRPFGAESRCRSVLPRRSGFSLLEVILALTILAGAVAVLGEVARHGLDMARHARLLTYAELICESQLSQIASGLVPAENVQQASVDSTSDPNEMGWVYSVETETTDVEGLIAVRVTVTQDLPEEKRPVRCTLIRWMQDPNATLSTSSDSGSNSTSNSGSGS